MPRISRRPSLLTPTAMITATDTMRLFYVAEVWSARLEYDYYGLGQRSALMTDPINGFTGVMNVQQSVQTVKLGVSFHMWAGQ